MKKILLLASLAALVGFLTACSEDEPQHHTVHHTHTHPSSPAVNSPSDESADNFQAVTKPDTYSGH